MVFCDLCGVENSNDSKYCQKCGNKLKSLETLNNSNYNNTNESNIFEYETHHIAIKLGFIPFYYANFTLFSPIFEIPVGLYLITRNNIRAKINGKWIIYLTLILTGEIMIAALLLRLI